MNKKVMTVGMVSFALASVLNAAPTTTGLTNKDGNTVPALTQSATSVVLENNANYQISGDNVYWSYATQTPSVMKWELTGSNANSTKGGIETMNKTSLLTINGAFKAQGSTMTWDMSKGGRIIVNGAENGKGWRDGTALEAHFGVNNFTLGNGAILEVKKDLRSIGGSTNTITLEGNSMLVVTGKLLADGNGVDTNNITATDSTVTLGGILGDGHWNGGDAGINIITVTNGKLTVNGDVRHVFDFTNQPNTPQEINPNHYNKITLNGGTHEITGSVVTDNIFGGRNLFNTTGGATLVIGGNVKADLLYNNNQHGLDATGQKTKFISENTFTLDGDGSKLHIKGSLIGIGGDVTKSGNTITMTGVGNIVIDGSLTMDLEDYNYGQARRYVFEGDNKNVVNAADSTLTIGRNLEAMPDGWLARATDAGNRINVKNLFIGNDLVARENDQYNKIVINGGKLDIKNEIRAFSKVSSASGASGAANYIELMDGSEMTVGGLVFADNYTPDAKSVNRIKASKSTITFNGDVKSHQGGKNDLYLTGSTVNLNGAISQLGEVKMDADSRIIYKGNTTIANSNSTGGTFVAAGENINSNLLTIDGSTNLTTYNLEVLGSLKNGDVVAKTKNTNFETSEGDDGLLTTKLMLKQMNLGDGYTMWVADGYNPILSRTAIDPNKEVITATGTLYLANMNSLNKRMGELRNIPNQHGAWGRIFGGQQTNDFANSKTGFVTVQAGYDYSFYVGKDRNNYVGAAFSYGFGSTDFQSNFVGNTASGIGYNLSNSSMTQHLIEFAIYNSFVEESGWYNDTILKLGGIMNSMSSTSIDLNTSNFAFTLSDEFGYRFKLGEKKNWYIDPQAEVTFGYVTGGEFTRRNGISNLLISYDGSTVIRERIGATAGWKALKDEKLDLDIYVGLFGEFDQYTGGDMKTKTSYAAEKSAVKTNMTSDMRGVVNYGVNVKMNKGIGMYLDMEHSFGGKLSTTYKVNGGVRYSFGDNKLQLIEDKVEDKAPIKLKEESKDAKKEETKSTKDAKESKDSKASKETKSETKKDSKSTKTTAKSTKSTDKKSSKSTSKDTKKSTSKK